MSRSKRVADNRGRRRARSASGSSQRRSHELEQMDSADPPLAVHRLHGGRHRQLRRHWDRRSLPSGSTYLPLLPLVLLLFTGLYLFVLPYATKWRGDAPTDT